MIHFVILSQIVEWSIFYCWTIETLLITTRFIIEQPILFINSLIMEDEGPTTDEQFIFRSIYYEAWNIIKIESPSFLYFSA